MAYKSYYDDPAEVKKIVEIGRQLITLCEENKLYPKDDLLWNAAVTELFLCVHHSKHPVAH